MVSVAWRLEKLNEERTLAFSLLSYLLMGHPAATLYKALTDAGHGSAVTGEGFDDTLAHPIFGVGVKDIRPGVEAAAVLNTVLTVLDEHAKNGFDEGDVEAAINTIEFTLREQSTGFAKGVALQLAALNRWTYGRDPIAGLRFEKPLGEVNKE